MTPSPEQIAYDKINTAWREAGLEGRRVLDTPGWQAAEAAVRRYCEGVGWTAPPMGPGGKDTWFNWLHILSHCLDDGGHGLTHAECELELAELAIAALPARPRSSRAY